MEPPYGTETFLLLARHELLELEDAKAFAEGLLSLGSAPAIEGPRLLVVDGTGSRIHEGTSLAEAGLSRGLSAEAVESQKGFLAEVVKGVPQKFTVVRALAFPYEVSTQDRPE